MIAEKPIESRCIAALQRELEVGSASALGQFWRDVERHGAPLVEPVADDDTHVLITFLWRATEPAKSVAIRNTE
jgi:hypothetical protein